MFSEIKNDLDKKIEESKFCPFHSSEVTHTYQSTDTVEHYTQYVIGLPQYSVFQIWNEVHTIHNGYFQGRHSEHIVAYADEIRIYEDKLVALLSHKEVAVLTKNHYDKDDFKERRYVVLHKHLK